MVLVITTTDERAEAFKAALSSLRADVYDADDIPSPLPAEWVEVGLTRTPGGADRLCGRAGVSLHYITFGAGGLTVSNVRRTLDAVSDALEGVLVPIGDTHTTPLRFYAETETEHLKELGRYWQLATYSYAI